MGNTDTSTHPTTVVNKHHGDPFDVYIGRGRGSQWGNPFITNRDGTLQEVLIKYELHLIQRIKDPAVLDELAALRGKRLQCFCAPRLCHGHILAHYADADPVGQPSTTAAKKLFGAALS